MPTQQLPALAVTVPAFSLQTDSYVDPNTTQKYVLYASSPPYQPPLMGQKVALCVETAHSTYFTTTSPLVSVLFVPSLHSYYFPENFYSFLVSVLFMQVSL